MVNYSGQAIKLLGKLSSRVYWTKNCFLITSKDKSKDKQNFLICMRKRAHSILIAIFYLFPSKIHTYIYIHINIRSYSRNSNEQLSLHKVAVSGCRYSSNSLFYLDTCTWMNHLRFINSKTQLISHAFNICITRTTWYVHDDALCVSKRNSFAIREVYVRFCINSPHCILLPLVVRRRTNHEKALSESTPHSAKQFVFWDNLRFVWAINRPGFCTFEGALGKAVHE